MHRFILVVCLTSIAACGRHGSTTAPNGSRPDAPPTVGATAVDSKRDSVSTLPPTPLFPPALDNVASSPESLRADAVSPFGLASSHLSSERLSAWLPTVRRTGVTWLRGFDVTAVAQRLTEIESQALNVSGILLWGPPGQPLTFPVRDLKGWSNHVGDLVSRSKGRVRHWEVWNEPPNFTQDKSPESYAKLVVAAYEAAKRADPAVQVGIAAKSNHVHWLEASIRAGARSHFDYVTLHPYEVLDVVAEGGEALFLNIVPTVRAMLRAVNPERAEVPIWFTELGTPVSPTTTPELQAARLVKAYTLGIAQGAARVHWFEGQDGDSGAFGLLDKAGRKRPAFTALSSLISAVGVVPVYVGWVTPSEGVYGFVFRGASSVVMVAWASPESPRLLDFETEVTMVEPTTGITKRGHHASANTVPVIVTGLPEAWAIQAAGNRRLPFPWHGDFSRARVVSLHAPNTEKGLHQFGKPAVRTFDGKLARDASTRASQSFAVDPNFASYDTGPLKISVALRRNGIAPAGFKLEYESVSGWKSFGGWYTVPEGDHFTTKEFIINDAKFVGNWGYHFTLNSDSKADSQYSIESVTVTKVENAP